MAKGTTKYKKMGGEGKDYRHRPFFEPEDCKSSGAQADEFYPYQPDDSHVLSGPHEIDMSEIPSITGGSGREDFGPNSRKDG